MSPDLRAELRTILPLDRAIQVTKSFDIYGSKQKAVAVVEIPNELRDVEREVAEALMRVNKNVSSVLAKESARTGDYRIRELRLIAGDPDTEVLHRESGCVFRLDPATVYFSPRESRERDRLAETVGDGEDILVMFSGIGPLPIRITKRHPNGHRGRRQRGLPWTGRGFRQGHDAPPPGGLQVPGSRRSIAERRGSGPSLPLGFPRGPLLGGREVDC
jgi:hypothetical protein